MNNNDQVSDCLHNKESLAALSEIENTIKNRIAGMIAGNIIGDMLGATQQFSVPGTPLTRPVKITDTFQKDIIGGGVYDSDPGDWTDDTSMLIALAVSLHRNSGRVNRSDEFDEYRKWLKKGFYTPDGKAFDVGRTTKNALNYKDCDDIRDNGNGALMRSSIIAPYYMNRSSSVIKDAAENSCAVTHQHEIALQCNGIYILILVSLLNGHSLTESVEKAKNAYPEMNDSIKEVFSRPDKYSNTGYAVTTLQAAILLNEESDTFEETLIKSVNIGGDADTIGAVTGAIAGAIHGYKNIPERWCRFLSHKELDKFHNILMLPEL